MKRPIKEQFCGRYALCHFIEAYIKRWQPANFKQVPKERADSCCCMGFVSFLTVKCWLYIVSARAENSLISFLSKLLVFCEKNERLSDSLKKRAIRSFAHFWKATWAICSHSSFKKREWANRSFFMFKKYTKKYDFRLLVKFFLANHSFAHLSWVTWAKRSRSLICHERPEWFAHSSSFFLSNLSKSLTVTHLIWAI